MSIITELEHNKQYIIKEYQSGRSSVKLGKEFNCDPAYISRQLHKWGVAVKKIKFFKGKVEDRHDEIIRMYNEGLSIAKIGVSLGITDTSIAKYMQKIGLDTTRYLKLDPNNLLQPKKDEVIRLWNDGKNCSEIERLIGNSRRNIAILLNENGIETDEELYEVDEDFFRVIDTEEKAYTFGFVCADGNVHNTESKLTIALQEGDIDILEKMKIAMKFNGPIGHKFTDEKRFHQRVLCICRKAMVKHLIALGCPPNKSLTLEFPTTVPTHLMNHFILGSWDGDGTIAKYSGYLTGSNKFTLGVQEKLSELAGVQSTITQKIKDREREMSCHGLYVGRKENYHKLLRFLYSGATIFLLRKARLALSVLPDLGISV